LAVLTPADYDTTKLSVSRRLSAARRHAEPHRISGPHVVSRATPPSASMIVVMPYLQQLLFNERNGQPAPIEDVPRA
jgi:hypothetical protein